jgi:3-deoxy-manno-octulosonate cytidylyltransferase (CMP-KDO synthetase)
MDILGVIPARYASTRFPGKPLVDIAGKSMIQRVVEKCLASKVFRKVVVATDDERIYDHVEALGYNVVRTSADHLSGTERCHEALKMDEGSYDFLINVQGDEPFIAPEQIQQLASVLDRKSRRSAEIVRSRRNKIKDFNRFDEKRNRRLSLHSIKASPLV